MGVFAKREEARGRAKDKREAKNYNRLVNSAFMPIKVTPRPEGSFVGVSRQVRRANTRRANAQIDRADKRVARKVAGQAKLDRQAAREKSGFYDGQTSVATALDHKHAGFFHKGDFE